MEGPVFTPTRATFPALGIVKEQILPCAGHGAGRDTNPVPCCMCTAVAVGRARQIGRVGKLK